MKKQQIYCIVTAILRSYTIQCLYMQRSGSILFEIQLKHK